MSKGGIFESSKNKWSEWAVKSLNQYLRMPDENLVRLFSGRYVEIPPPPARVMDHGFGSANTLLYLAHKGYRCSGCEISEVLVEQGRKEFEGAGCSGDLKLLDGSQLPFDDASQDVVVSWNAIHYNGRIEVVREVVAEFLRILSPGGTLLMSTVHPSHSIAQRMCPADDSGTSFLIEQTSAYDNRQGLTFFMAGEEIWQELLSGFSEVRFGSTHFDLFLKDKVHWGLLVYARK